MRFVASGALDLPRDRYELIFGATDECRDDLRAALHERGFDGLDSILGLSVAPERFQIWKDLFDSSCVRFRAISPSFEMRAEAQRRAGTAAYMLQRIRSAPGIYEARREILRRLLPVEPAIANALREARPNWVVLPSALMDLLTEDVLLAARRAGFKTLLLSSNWDNLSSKGLLTLKPDWLACWGDQTRDHAATIQKVPADRIVPLGAPHFDAVFEAMSSSKTEAKARLGLDPNRTTIFFAGSFREIDETSMLRELDDAISRGELPPAQVLYRPHPWRMHRNEEPFDSVTWQNVRLDPGMSEALARMNQTKAAADSGFDLRHLGSLYRAADVLISPMSTALLEAMHFDLPILALNFGDGRHYWSPDKAGAMIHFKEFYELPGIHVLRERDGLLAGTRNLLGDSEAAVERRARLSFFVRTQPGTYSERLNDLLQSLNSN